jgi:hypothetical protein
MESIAGDIAALALLRSGYGSIMRHDSGKLLRSIAKNNIDRHKQPVPGRTNAMSVRFYAPPE